MQITNLVYSKSVCTWNMCTEICLLASYCIAKRWNADLTVGSLLFIYIQGEIFSC